jgi:hypothetical protein
MATEPVTLFAHTANPGKVIDVLRIMNANFKVVGPDDNWSEILVTSGGWLRKKQLRISHDRHYYTGEGWARQMDGMRGYLSRFPYAPEQQRILALTEQFNFAIGTIFEPDATDDDERYAVLAAIAEALEAVCFTPTSMRDANGSVLYGADVSAIDPHARWPSYAPPPAALDPLSAQALALKQAVFSELAGLGFQPASSLPLPDLNLRVRNPQEVCARLMALQAVCAWVMMTVEEAGTDALQVYIARNGLRAAMTQSEAAIIDLPREQARAMHANTIGWRMENMWPLAWILGFAQPPQLDAEQINREIISAMFLDFLPGWAGNVADFAQRAALRPDSEVVSMEYKFYCAHNAVRSAQMGGATVPAGFDPVAHGGAVHERRHALTWALAPADSWDDTDLST